LLKIVLVFSRRWQFIILKRKGEYSSRKIVFLKKKRRVFFKENRIVHWGEWDFGSLLIQGSEDVEDVFGDYVSEIRFEPEAEKSAKKEGYIEVYLENIDIIHYDLEEV